MFQIIRGTEKEDRRTTGGKSKNIARNWNGRGRPILAILEEPG